MLKVLSENSYQATLAEIDLGQIGATKKRAFFGMMGSQEAVM